MVKTYQSLDPEIKKIINDMSGYFVFARRWDWPPTYYKTCGVEYYQTNGVRHPLVTCHPHTGEPVLNIDPEFCQLFEGFSEIETHILKKKILETVLTQENIKAWRYRVNDVVIWDNRTVIHSATHDYTENRTMWRTTIVQ
jgi:alpha-ketoglutarate-dependent taurine dioxygenase